MADLIVTYSRARYVSDHYQMFLPVAFGKEARTEAIPIGVSSAVGTLVAGARDMFVELYAGAACWVRIVGSEEGSPPVYAEASAATSGSPQTTSQSRFMPEGTVRDLVIRAGETVAVIAAS